VEDALCSLQTQIQDFVQGRKNAEEFMEEMTKALEVENSHAVILNLLENKIVFLRDSIFTGEIKIKDLINPPLQTQSSLLSSAQLSSTESRRGIWLET